MAKVTGIVKIYVNGKLLRSKEGAALKTGGMEREGVNGHSHYGYTENLVNAELDCTLAHTADTDVIEANDFVGATLKFETDTGQVLVVTNAFTSEPCEVKQGGDMSLKMMGDRAFAE